jgi:hypothetical protein
VDLSKCPTKSSSGMESRLIIYGDENTHCFNTFKETWIWTMYLWLLCLLPHLECI